MRTILQRLLVTYLAVMVLTVGVMALVLTHYLNSYYFEVKEKQLREQGENVKQQILLYRSGQITKKELEHYVDATSASTGARVVALNLNEVENSSEGISSWKKFSEDQFYDLRQILDGQTITRKRQFGSNRDTDVVMVGMPIKTAQGKVEGIILLLSPLTGVRQNLNTVTRIVFEVAALFSLIAAVLIYGASRRISRPMVAISEASVRIARGEEEPDIPVEGRDEVSRLAASFNFMKNRLHQIEEMRNDLIANVSHELRTPLTSIGGFVQAILDGKVKAEDEHRYLQLVYQETRRVTRLTNDLLLLAQVQSGSLELSRETLCLSEVMDEVLQSLALDIIGKQIRVSHHIPPKMPNVEADRDRLKQVVLNIMGNALRYTPTHGDISVTYDHDGQMLTTSISDSGPGLPENDRQLIFEKFYRVDSSRQGGSGLGLSIVKTLVELHGGQVMATNSLQGGTTIAFSLHIANNE